MARGADPVPILVSLKAVDPRSIRITARWSWSRRCRGCCAHHNSVWWRKGVFLIRLKAHVATRCGWVDIAFALRRGWMQEPSYDCGAGLGRVC